MSLKQRVILTTAVAVVVAASVVGLLAYTIIAGQLLATVDTTLRVAAAEAKMGGNEDVGGPPLPSDVSVEVATGRVDLATGAVIVVRQAGTSADPQPFPRLTPAELVLAARDPLSVDAPGPYRVYVRIMDPRRGAAVAVMSLERYQQSLNQFAWSLTGALVGVLLVLLAASWLIARRMFVPLDDIVRSAEGITARDVSARVPAHGNASEVRRLAASLNSMIDRLAESEGSLRAFIADTSHEIRTPLTVISGYLQQLEVGASQGAPVDPEVLRRMSRESQRLDRLVTQLLRLDAVGTRTSTVSSVRLDELIREELADLVALDGTRFITLSLEPVSIEGEEDSLRQLMANIRQNLERHTPPGSIIEATLTIQGSEALLLVDDSGPGIPDPQRRAALSSTRRDETARGRSTEGFGLGMTIIATVVAHHGGTLSLDTSPLGGLRTRIALPLHAKATW